jgi:hypothetical protein
MKLSFSTRGWPNLTWEEMLETAQDMGFAGVEVYNLPKFNPLLEKSGPFHKYQTAATVRQLRELKLQIPCFDTSWDISAADCNGCQEFAGKTLQRAFSFVSSRPCVHCRSIGYEYDLYALFFPGYCYSADCIFSSPSGVFR